MSSPNHDRQAALRQELLEYAFDCHPDPETIRARIAHEPEVAALFAEARATAALLQSAATAEGPALDLELPPSRDGQLPESGADASARDRGGRRTGRWAMGAWTMRRTWIAAAALVAVAVLPALGIFVYRAWQLHDLRTGQVRVVVSAPAAIPDGSPLRFHVETINLAQQAMRTDIDWKVLGEGGATLTASTAICNGTTDITVAGSLNKPRRLVITATEPHTGFSKTITQDIHPTRAAPLVHLTSDKPAYRPGEAVRLRVACLDRLTLRGAEAAGLRCRILDPKGGVTHNTVLGVGKGVAAQVWDIPAHAAGGNYRFEVRDHKDRFTLDHIEFLVRNFQPPTLKKKVTLDRQTYAVGTAGKATLQVDRLSGGRAAGAKVRAALVVDGEETWHADAELDLEGRAQFAFQVPGNVLRGAARFIARVTDGGRVETALEPFVIPTDKVEVGLYPEGGDLIAGAENRVYAQVRDALGRPLSGEGEVVDGRGEVVAAFRTLHMGRSRFAFTPQQGRSYQLKLRSPIAKDFDLPAVKPKGVVLRAVGDVVTVGQPVDVSVYASGAGPWIVAVFCRGVMVGQKSVLDRGRHAVQIPVVASASGVLRVTVFDRDMRPVAERLVQRQAEQQLNLALTPQSARATPGSKQVVKVKTTDETGEPLSCFVGLSVTDKAVADMLDFIRTGLLDQQQLWTDVEQPDDKLEEFLASDAHQHRNTDLLLGSLGWRRYVWKDAPDDQKIAALGALGGDWAKALTVREGRSWAPVVTDTLGLHTRDLQRAMASRRDARELMFGFATLSLLFLLLVAGTHLLFVLSRWWGIRPRVLVGSTGALAAAGLVLVVFSLQKTGIERFSADAAPTLSAAEGLVAAEPPGRGFLYDESEDLRITAGLRNVWAGSDSGFAAEPGLDPWSTGTRFGPVAGFGDYGDLPSAGGIGGIVGNDLSSAFDPFMMLYPCPQIPTSGSDEFFMGSARATKIVDNVDQIASAFDSSAWNTAVGLVDGRFSEAQRARFFQAVNSRYPGVFYTLQPPVDGTVQAFANGVATVKLTLGQEALRSGQSFALFNPTEGYKGEGRVQQVLQGGQAQVAVQLDSGIVLRVGDYASTNVRRGGWQVAEDLQKYIVTRMDTRHLTQLVYRYLQKPATGSGAGRGDFTETLFWQPFLVTDEKGEATVEFDVSDSITTWSVHADAHGNGRIGQATATFESYTPFYLTPTVPAEVSEGDRLRLPIAIVADDQTATQAQLNLGTYGPIAMPAGGQQTVTLHQGRGRALLEVEVGEAGGSGAPGGIHIQGQLGGVRDIVKQSFTVVPRGFPYAVSRAGRIGGQGQHGKVAFDLEFPSDDLAKRTATLKLRFFPSPLADLEQAIAGMLQQPGGCFEQVSSSNYPNVMALHLLRASGDDIPAAAAQAQQFLASGYKQLVAYEVDGGGFEWWGKQPAHAALTAYGLMQFTDMASVFEVDRAMVARTRNWLLGKRDGKGGFTTGGGRYGHFQGGSAESRSSYIAYALLYSGEPPATMRAEIDYLAQRAKTTDNAYELAVAACALDVAKHPTAAAARQRLAERQEQDGSVMGASSITSSGERDLRIETTAFAVLAWIVDTERADAVQRAVGFLTQQRQGAGHFGSTQATVMALKALSAYSSSAVKALKPGAIVIRMNGEELRHLELAGTEKRAIEVDLSAAFAQAPAGKRTFELELTNGNTFPYSLDLGYRADLPNSHPACALGLSTWLSNQVVEEGDALALHAVVENKTGAPVANPMVIVGLPAGLHVAANILDDLKKAETIAAWELRGRDIVLYLRGLEAGEKRDIIVDVTGRIPGTTSGPASRAYLYYTQDQKCWADPLRVEVRAGR